MDIIVYCDGACAVHTDQIGGYAAILKYDEQTKEIVGNVQDTTNNQMELMSAIAAFRAINSLFKFPCNITVISDSQYVVKGMSEWLPNWQKKGWKTAAKKPVSNKELWMELSELSKHHNIVWKWTKGHSDCEDNNKCDELAVEAIDKLREELLNGSEATRDTRSG